MTNKEAYKLIEEAISKMTSAYRHPLENIAVGFSPFVPDNQIWYMKKMNFHNKKVLLFSPNLKNLLEELEKKEGIRAERLGERTEILPHQLLSETLITDSEHLLFDRYEQESKNKKET